MTASKTPTALTQVQLLVAVAAASQRQADSDLDRRSLSQISAAAVGRIVEYSCARASSLCCKQGVGPAVARMSGEVAKSSARVQHQKLAIGLIRIRGMELLGQTASVGCWRDVRSVGKACLEAATWVEEQTEAFGE